MANGDRANSKETTVLQRQREGLDASKDPSAYNRIMTYRDTKSVVDNKNTAIGSSLIAPPTGIPAFTLVCVGAGDTMKIADRTSSATMPCFGITTEVVPPNARSLVVNHGIVENPLWNFMPRAVLFVGTLGTITTSPPATGFLQKIGQAITATKISVNIEDFSIRRA